MSNFKMKYPIEANFLPLVSKGRRQGIKAKKIKFIVLHDVGNDGKNKSGTTAAANINYYKNSKNELASAHAFIDDAHIYECIPATLGTPEKAWHVLYNKTVDNRMYGADANDAAIGVELCYFPNNKDRSTKAYKKFVWYCAYLAFYFGLDPSTCFVGHETLDPGRKTDPSNGLRWINKTTKQCIQDIQKEYRDCLAVIKGSVRKEVQEESKVKQIGTVKILKETELRKQDKADSEVIRILKAEETYKVYGVNEWGYDLGGGSVTQDTKYTEYLPYIGVAEVLTSTLNVRKEDNVESSIVKEVKRGERYKVYSIGKWGYNVGSGWISKGESFTKLHGVF